MRVFAFVFVLACSSSSGGPRQRMREFGGCDVPASVVQIEDQLQGAEAWTYWGMVVMEKDGLPEFLDGCGVRLEDFRLGAQHESLAPDPRPRWWQLPSPEYVGWARSPQRDLLLLERDTDVAVFVVARDAD